MSNLAQIQPQRQDFDTQQTCDWLDPLPVIVRAGAAAAVAGAGNVGNGALGVASVDPGTPLRPLTVTVTGIVGGVARLSVTDVDGASIAQGAVGLACYAGGVTFTLSQGTTPFAAGDAFALGVLPQPVDLTGLRFDLDGRAAIGAATFAMRASTADATPTIVNGGASGVIAMRVLRAAMARCAVGDFPYSILAADPATGLTVPAFYGILHHRAVAAQLAEGA